MIRQPINQADSVLQQVLEAGETVQWSGQASQPSMVSFQNIATGLSLIFDFVIIGVLWWTKIVEPWMILLFGIGAISVTLLSALLRSGRSKAKTAGLYVITNHRILEIRSMPYLGLDSIAILPEAIDTIRVLAGKTPTNGTLEIQASQYSSLAAPSVPQGRIVRTWNNIDNVQTVQMQIEALRSNSRRSMF